MVGNRGARPENIPSGILVFSTEKTQPHDLEKLFEFINDGYGTDYYAKLYEMLDQFFGVPIYVLDMPEQSAGNCSWVALELILTSRIFMDKFNTVTNEKAGTVSQGVSLFLLREVYKDRVRTYVRSNSSLKSKEILESCYHFSAGANLVDYSWEGESRQPGQATYPWFSSILDQALLEESCAELANLGYSCPYRRNNNFILAVQTTIVGGLGLTLYGSVKLIKTLRAILNK